LPSWGSLLLSEALGQKPYVARDDTIDGRELQAVQSSYLLLPRFLQAHPPLDRNAFEDEPHVRRVRFGDARMVVSTVGRQGACFEAVNPRGGLRAIGYFNGVLPHR
jgi:hypothetical protein